MCIVKKHNIFKNKKNYHVNLLLVQNKYFPKIYKFKESLEDNGNHNDGEVEIKYHYL